MLTRKQPRDFVYLDELWEADEHWTHYFIGQKLWLYADSYRAELLGDQDYCRIIVHSSSQDGWIYQRHLSDKQQVLNVLEKIALPVSVTQLKELAFTPWKDHYI